jgi:hypothetical protein
MHLRRSKLGEHQSECSVEECGKYAVCGKSSGLLVNDPHDISSLVSRRLSAWRDFDSEAVMSAWQLKSRNNLAVIKFWQASSGNRSDQPVTCMLRLLNVSGS